MAPRKRRTRKATIQLTSLLDLLFIMIFVSLVQNHSVSLAPEAVEASVDEVVDHPVPEVEPSEEFIQAVFEFYPTENSPSLPRGSFLMTGVFEPSTSDLRLHGERWLERPQGYDMVPLHGTIDEGRRIFKGAIDFPGCEKFTLTRVNTSSGSSIAGEWRGRYICSQGETGLSLTIN